MRAITASGASVGVVNDFFFVCLGCESSNVNVFLRDGELSAELVNWRAELQNTTIGLNMPKDARDTNRLPDDELFDNPVGRTLPCAPLPTIDTPFGQSVLIKTLSLRRLWEFHNNWPRLWWD